MSTVLYKNKKGGGGGGASVSIRSLHLACNAELSPERYWRGPGAQKGLGGGGGVQYLTPTLSPAEWFLH